MLELRDVTLCCVDTVNHALALRALERSQSGIAFARTLFLTHALPADVAVPGGIDTVDIAPLRSRDDYSWFVLKSLAGYIDTSHVLLVQWDGFVVNPAAWSTAFLDCDYLGAKWFWYEDGMRVGNGGFSLRSRRLLQALQDPRIVLAEAEDLTIGRAFRPLLEHEHGIRFGSEDLADRFAFEAAYPIGKPFGFHGLFNFCRTVLPEEIVAMARGFSDTIACSPQLLQLLRNCAAMAQWDAVAAIAERMLAADASATEARTWQERAQARLAKPVAVGRNDPCPCGSGRRYKLCHGVIRQATVGNEGTNDRENAVKAALAQGMAAHQRGDLQAAEAAYQQALYWTADQPVALHYLGVIHYQRGRLAEAIPLLTASSEKQPGEPEFHNNLGLALAAADRNEEAIAAYRRTLALKPEHAIAWNNLGLAFTALNRLPEAVAAYSESIARAPQFGEAHWNLALALLAMGRFPEGWREYEWRLALPRLGQGIATRSGPRWDGVLRRGMTLLVHAEQGLGDTIQFARFARVLDDSGTRVVLEVAPRLQEVLRSVPGVAEVCTSAASTPAYDAHVPMLSLPGLLGVDAGNIPGETPYLSATPQRRARVRDEIGTFQGTRKIGLCWSGSAAHSNDARRSMPFAALAPLLGVSGGITWFSLQHGVAMGPPLVELAARDTMDDVAALISELDLVIGVDTSMAHLAAALGRPTWLLLSYAADWRWGLHRTESAWYPTMRIFRQPRIGDWASVVREVGETLRASSG